MKQNYYYLLGKSSTTSRDRVDILRNILAVVFFLKKEIIIEKRCIFIKKYHLQHVATIQFANNLLKKEILEK